MPSPDRLHHNFGALLGIQVRTVGLAIARETVLAALALASLCFLSTVTALRYHEHLHALPEPLLAAVPAALLLPWAVWKGDPAFGPALLWTLPVRRQEAAAAKILAGAIWLMLAVLLGLAAFILTAVATGGDVGIEQVRLVGSFAAGPSHAQRVVWTTPLWMWLVPFGAALTAYFASSAILLGFRYPLRWIAGVAVAVTLLGVLSANLGPGNLLQAALDRFFQTIVGGKYGLDFAVTGGIAALSEEIDVPGPGSVDLWKSLPTMGQWSLGLLVWLAAALLALALALRRHWER